MEHCNPSVVSAPPYPLLLTTCISRVTVRASRRLAFFPAISQNKIDL